MLDNSSIVNVEELRQTELTDKTTKMFSVSGLDKEYVTGGTFYMYPQSSDTFVNKMIDFLGLAPNDIVEIEDRSDSPKSYPKRVQVSFLLKQIIDLHAAVRYTVISYHQDLQTEQYQG